MLFWAELFLDGVSSQRPASCCPVLLFIQSENSCVLLIAPFLPEREERGETANYSPAQHIIHTLRCVPAQWQMIFCFKILRFISIPVLSRISHLLRFSLSLSAGASSSFTFLKVWGVIAPCQCYHSHPISINWIGLAKVSDAIEPGFVKRKVKNLRRGKTENYRQRK